MKAFEFEYMSYLQYRVKSLERQVVGFESGTRYQQIQKEYEIALKQKDYEIRCLQKEKEELRLQNQKNRKHWMEVLEDVENDKIKMQRSCEREMEKLQRRVTQLETALAEERGKKKELRKELYAVKTELEELKGINQKLLAQLNHNYENSSISSSASKNKNKKIPNSREKTGKKPGAQKGDPHHPRKRQEPTEAPILLPPPEEVLRDPGFKKTGKTIIKQQIGLEMRLVVKEYHAQVYYNASTGERIHATFPAGVVNEVNYDGSIKAFLFLLTNDCCVSIDKSKRLLSDLTGGQLELSKGWIHGLTKEFAAKTEKERDALKQLLLEVPVLHTDATCARMNGKNVNVYVCATPKGEALYYAREKKGHAGIKGTVVEDYQGILIHDHDTSYYSYGSNHQECLAHILRYLKDSIQNESDREWNTQMHTVVREMIHYVNGVPEGELYDPVQIETFEQRYDEVLNKAKEEYDYIPASDYYRDGYNLYRRMEKYRENHLLFLHDARVPHNNNLAERFLRAYRRKQEQAISFRSFDQIEHLCECMSVLVWVRQKGKNVFEQVSQIFNQVG